MAGCCTPRSELVPILDLFTDPVIVADASWKVSYANPAALALIGKGADAVIGGDLWKVWPQIRTSEFEARWRAAWTTSREQRFEGQYDDTDVWFESVCSPHEGELFIHLHDCTKRKHAEEALRKAELRISSLTDRLPGGIVLVDGESVSLNARVEEMLGIKPGSVRTIQDWFLKTRGGNRIDAERARKDYLQVKRQGFRSGRTVQLMHSDGSTRIVDVSAWEDELGEVWLLYDLTEKLANEEKFRILFEQSSDAHVLVDDSGIVDCNEATIELLGCSTKAELLHRHPSEFSPRRQPDGSWSVDKSAEMNAIAKKYGHHRFEWVHLALDGRLVPCEVTVTELTIGGKAAQLVAWRDLTLQKEAEDALRKSADDMRRMADELKQTNAKVVAAHEAALESGEAKSQFLATMSHEIRTPLNGVVGVANLLLQTRLTSEQHEYVRTILASSQTLLRVINDVLDIGKVEAGKLTIEPSDVELVGLIADTVKLFRGQAEEKRIALSVVSSCPELHVWADGVRIKQVVGNLVTNALKFTPRGEVTVTITSEAAADMAESLRIAVTDTGLGIAPERLEAIFETYTQADAATQSIYGGTGLGLAISKRLVELMGGRIWVDSKVGTGSTFTIQLPLSRPVRESATPPPVETPVPPPAKPPAIKFEGLKVLLAEDNPVNVMVARKLLERLGCGVSVAQCGDEAVAQAKAQAFDLILMDLQMPGKDGISATKDILRSRSIPIVALTANAMEEHRQACRDAGMVGFLAKPLSPQELTQVLQRLVNDASPARS